jgi:hypothetical protein
MALSTYFAKVFGIALIVAGVSVILYRNSYIKTVSGFIEDRLFRLTIAFCEMLAGLFLIVAHNVWTPLPAAIITVLGWITAIEGAAFMLLPDDMLRRFMSIVNRPRVYLVSGIVTIVLGIYLADYGFALWPRFQ